MPAMYGDSNPRKRFPMSRVCSFCANYCRKIRSRCHIHMIQVRYPGPTRLLLQILGSFLVGVLRRRTLLFGVILRPHAAVRTDLASIIGQNEQTRVIGKRRACKTAMPKSSCPREVVLLVCINFLGRHALLQVPKNRNDLDFIAVTGRKRPISYFTSCNHN